MSATAGPVLCDGAAVMTCEDTLVVATGYVVRRFEGRAVPMLRRLLDLMDGRRDAGELSVLTGAPEAQVTGLIELLRTSSLLDAAPGQNPDSLPEAARKFYSRTLAYADAALTSSTELIAQLGKVVVPVLGPRDFADAITSDLAAAGVRAVLVTDPRAIVDAARAPDGTTRIALVIDHLATDIASIFDHVARHGVDVLRVAYGAHGVEVGPVLTRDHGPCGSCIRHSLKAGDCSAPVWAVLAAAQAAARLIGYFGGPFGTSDPRVMSRYGDVASEQAEILPTPGCPACEPGNHAGASPGPAWSYEVSAEIEPGRFVAASSGEDLRSARLATFGAQRAEHPRSARIVLPDNPPVRFARALASAWCAGVDPAEEGVPALSLDMLAALCRHCFGRRSVENSRRWVPSGGEYGSAGVIAIAAQGRVPLPGTAFSYDDRHHQLVALSRSARPWNVLREHTDIADSSVGLVVTSAVPRLAGKYGRFALRLAHLDAGFACLQLAMLADRLGLPLRFLTGWQESLPESLDILPGTDIVTAVAVLGPADKPAQPSEGWAARVHRDLGRRDNIPVAATVRAGADHAHRCADALSLGELLSQRRSAPTNVALGAVTPEAVGRIIATARAHDRAYFPAATDQSLILVGARRLDGMPPGIYDDACRPIDTDPLPAESIVAELDIDAAAYLMLGYQVTPDISSDVMAHTWVSAGAFAYDVLLAAIGAGLAARPLGGATHGVSTVTGRMRQGYRHVMTVGIGARPR